MSDRQEEETECRGVHHVTAIAGDPGRNLRFYRDVLGLRVLKRTVNHDDPGTHHLYFGDGDGRPGSTLTFFPWPGAPRGRQGRGQPGRITLAVPAGSREFWRERLEGRDVEAVERAEGTEGVPADRPALHFRDPDGLALGLAEVEVVPPSSPWEGPVPEERAIRGIASIELVSRRPDATRAILTDPLGFAAPSDDPGGELLEARGKGSHPGRLVRLSAGDEAPRGRTGVGTVHHVAWRTPDEEHQDRWRAELGERGLSVTAPVDRYYFRSIYFREPGGILFEVATEGPGFTRDEDMEELGSGLRLPPWLEDRRAEIQERLPPMDAPSEGG